MSSTLLDDAIALGDRLLRIDPAGLPPSVLKLLAETAADLAVIFAALDPEHAALLEAGDVRSFEALRGLLRRQ